MWQEADPQATSVIQGVLANYKHELLVDNFVGIPLLVQHGSADDNVPVFHSRRMYQILTETKGHRRFLSSKVEDANTDLADVQLNQLDRSVDNKRGREASQDLFNPRAEDALAETFLSPDEEVILDETFRDKVQGENAKSHDLTPSSSTWPLEYVELTGKGHWFNGVMSTPRLKEFYEQYLNSTSNITPLPLHFLIRVSGSGAMGSRGGIEIDQVLSPDQHGQIEVFRDDANALWYLKTSNIQRFHICIANVRVSAPRGLIIDGEPHTHRLDNDPGADWLWFFKSRDKWEVITPFLNILRL
jgi:hypothetical protein